MLSVETSPVGLRNSMGVIEPCERLDSHRIRFCDTWNRMRSWDMSCQVLRLVPVNTVVCWLVKHRSTYPALRKTRQEYPP